MYSVLYLTVLFLWPTAILAAQVKWRPNTSFELPLNFLEGKRPCSRQTVYFPARVVSAVRISSVNDVSSLVMPIDGELSLSEGAAINFGSKPDEGMAKHNEVCLESDTHYVVKSSPSWLQTDVWQAYKFNAATPDAQRMPCFDDDVVFPEDSQFSIKLPDVVQYVNSVRIAGNEVDRVRFKEIAESSSDEAQSFILNNMLSLGVVIESKSCEVRAGCPCQDNATIVDCSLAWCRPTKCKDPVLPEGNCCPICGGVLTFDINMNTFDFMSFKKSIEMVAADYGGKEKITYHVGLLWKGRIQVVMVDNGDYEGNSAIAVHTLARGLDHGLAAGFKQSLISGSPLSKVGTGGEIVGVTFLMVVLIFGSMYVWFQRPDLVAVIPLPRLPAQTSNMFSRFDNRRSSITSLASRGSVAFGTSFRNPLYRSKRREPAETSSNVTISSVHGGATVAAPVEQDGGGEENASRVEHVTQMSLIPNLE